MSIKYFNKQTQQWEIFPGTAGTSAYESAQKGGYKGTEEEFNGQIANFETILRKEIEITDSADDVHYPSSKAVKNYVDTKNVSVNIPFEVTNLNSEASALNIITAFGGETNFKSIYTSALTGKLLTIRSNTNISVLYSVNVTTNLFKYYYVIDSTHYLHKIIIDSSTKLPTSITVQKANLNFQPE